MAEHKSPTKQERDLDGCAESSAALKRDMADEQFAEMIRDRVAAMVEKPKPSPLTREQFLEQTAIPE